MAQTKYRQTFIVGMKASRRCWFQSVFESVVPAISKIDAFPQKTRHDPNSLRRTSCSNPSWAASSEAASQQLRAGGWTRSTPPVQRHHGCC